MREKLSIYVYLKWQLFQLPFFCGGVHILYGVAPSSFLLICLYTGVDFFFGYNTAVDFAIKQQFSFSFVFLERKKKEERNREN